MSGMLRDALVLAALATAAFGYEGRYDRLLEAVHSVDAYLAGLWSAVQSHPQYRGRTTLIFTADHGRGRTPCDWTDHGRRVAGADEVFIAMIGPGVTAAGEVRGHAPLTQSQVAATVAAALDLDYAAAAPRAAAPIAGQARVPALAPR